LFELVEVIKIDQHEIPAEHIKHLKQWPVKLLAGQVENTAQAVQYRDLGFDLLQGYSFAHPVELHAEHADTSKLELMKLLELVLADAETHEIERAFKRDPSLVYNLLRMVNSGSSGGRYKVSSLKQAITILGRQQIRRWLQLLLFVGKSGDMQTPLLELAATRGKLMELLAISHSRMDRDFHERAFMTGIMSLLDTLLGIPMEEVVKQVSLAGDIESALLSHEGKLGNLLLLVEKMEQNDFDAAEGLLADMHLSLSNLTQAQIEAMRWANSLSETAES
jgi:EAL and modified HD-GYP domain-containing signal transduction protein